MYFNDDSKLHFEFEFNMPFSRYISNIMVTGNMIEVLDKEGDFFFLKYDTIKAIKIYK